MIDEHILFRLHETAQKNRIGAYSFTLLMLRHISRASFSHLPETEKLIQNLTNSWETLPFITPLSNPSVQEQDHLFAIILSFWLAKPGSLYELILNIDKDCPNRIRLIENGLLALLELGYPRLIEFILSVKYSNESDPELLKMKKVYQIAIQNGPVTKILSALQEKERNELHYFLLFKNLTLRESGALLFDLKESKEFDFLYIWALLLCGKKEEANKHLEGKPIETPSSPYFLLQGCSLAATEGETAALFHFNLLLDAPFPTSFTLLGHFLKGTIRLRGPWFEQAFLWEKIQLYKQLTLYYTCLKKHDKARRWEKMIQEESKRYEVTLSFM